MFCPRFQLWAGDCAKLILSPVALWKTVFLKKVFRSIRIYFEKIIFTHIVHICYRYPFYKSVVESCVPSQSRAVRNFQISICRSLFNIIVPCYLRLLRDRILRDLSLNLCTISSRLNCHMPYPIHPSFNQVSYISQMLKLQSRKKFPT
jgi:hypothetical protein